MYACMYTQGCVRDGLVLGRHPRINLFGLHHCVTCCEVETKFVFSVLCLLSLNEVATLQ